MTRVSRCHPEHQPNSQFHGASRKFAAGLVMIASGEFTNDVATQSAMKEYGEIVADTSSHGNENSADFLRIEASRCFHHCAMLGAINTATRQTSIR
jgi:hypothetical protein